MQSSRPPELPYKRRRRAEQLKAQVAEAKRRHRKPLLVTFTLVNNIALFAASLAAILGVMFWLIEWDDRAEERSVRRAQLVESAFHAIEEATADKSQPLELSPRLDWAMRTLVEHGEVVEIFHPSLFLQGLDLSCGTYYLKSNSVFISGLISDRANVHISSDTIVLKDVDAIAANFLFTNPSGPSSEVASLDINSWVTPPGATPNQRVGQGTVINGKLQGSGMQFQGPALLDIDGFDTVIYDAEGYLRLDAFKMSSWARIDVDQKAFHTGIEPKPDVAELPAIFGSRVETATTSYRALTPEFSNLCPEGRCRQKDYAPPKRRTQRNCKSKVVEFDNRAWPLDDDRWTK